MRTIIAAIVLSIITSSSMATTLKEFNAMPKAKQSTVVADFVDKITTDLRAKNEKLAIQIRNWFAVKPEGKPTSEGMERLVIELAVIELQAKEGRADLAKIQLESVIVWIIKQKFPPPAK
jgi:soluble cytochrome b562